jgi:hypothetical protein
VISFYLDENVPPEIAEQLRRDGIDVVTVGELEVLGDSDDNHLERAKQLGRVLCTHDQDYLRMNTAGTEHAGIAFAKQYEASIGGWVKALKILYTTATAEEMIGQVRYLKVK